MHKKYINRQERKELQKMLNFLFEEVETVGGKTGRLAFFCAYPRFKKEDFQKTFERSNYPEMTLMRLYNELLHSYFRNQNLFFEGKPAILQATDGKKSYYFAVEKV